MENGAILDYSARIQAKLRNADYRPAPLAPGGVDMYTPMPVQGGDANAPFSVVYVLAWSEAMEKERPAWETLIATSRDSLARAYPTANVTLIDMGKIADGKAFPLVYSQVIAKMRRSVRGNLVFLDTDVLAYNPCDPFALDFDVGLTDCDDLWPMQPFNAGVQFYKDTPAAQRYCDTAAHVTTAVPGNFDKWYGYQIGMRTAYDMLKDSVDFVVFPHEMYNFTPERDLEETDAYFVHSRGARKNLQFDYYKRLTARSGA